MSNRDDPRWKIAEEWAVDTDPYQWILYYRTPGRKRWSVQGFYPTAVLLLEDLRQKIERTSPSKSIPATITAALRAATDAQERFSALLKQEVWSGLTRPHRGVKR